MRRYSVLVVPGVVLCCTLVGPAGAAPLGTAFTYQGRLSDGGSPANGVYDLQFSLWDAAVSGGQVGNTICRDNVTVTAGLFTVELDFGAGPQGAGAGPIDGEARWLQIGVRLGGAVGDCGTGTYTTLSPRQPLDATPYALALRLPFKQTVANTNPFGGAAFSITNTGNGAAGSFATTSTSNTTAALVASVPLDNEEPALLVHGPQTSGVPGTQGANKGALRITTGNIPQSTSGLFLDATGIDRNGTLDIQANTNDDVSMVVGGGDVGIGTNAPTARLEVAGGAGPLPVVLIHGGTGPGPTLRVNGTNDASLTNDGLLMLGSSSSTNIILDRNEMMARNGSNTAPLALNALGGNVTLVQSGTGGVTIGTSSVPSGIKLNVNGTTRTKVLEITGADLAEKFPTSEEVKPGMVVAIDPDSPGRLRLSRGAYNRCVAGIVSGANDFSVGAVLGHLPGNEDAPAVALSGRVYCWCDASAGAIRTGDLLTTSDTPGQAMSVEDPARAQGAIIGKAMTALPQGEKGLVLVLVSLQ